MAIPKWTLGGLGLTDDGQNSLVRMHYLSMGKLRLIPEKLANPQEIRDEAIPLARASLRSDSEFTAPTSVSLMQSLSEPLKRLAPIPLRRTESASQIATNSSSLQSVRRRWCCSRNSPPHFLVDLNESRRLGR